MNRVVELFRVTSSVTAVVLLVVMNLVPLAGVLFWGWNVFSLLVLYWIENGVIGVLNIARILRAEGSILPGGWTFQLGGRATRARGAMVLFFLLHYGIFWAVHGVFVLLLPLFIGLGSSMVDPGDARFPSVADAGLRWEIIAFGALGLTVSHAASYFLNYIGRREYRHVSPAAQTMAPYGRVVVLHLTILLGAFVSAALGSPVGAVGVLVVVKTIVDLALHLAEHRRGATDRAPTTV